MKLLLIITDYGGFNNFLSEVAVQLIREGHEVHVICSPVKVIDYTDKYNYTALGIAFHYLDFPRSFNLFKQIAASKNINRKITEIQPDLINIHFTTGIFTTVVWRKPPFFTIGTIHGIGYPVIRERIKRNIFKVVERLCFSRLDQVYVINDFDYCLVKSIYPNKAFKHVSYGVGCDLRKFNALNFTDKAKLDIRADLSINKEDFVLMFTGRFVAFKGFNLIIEAMVSIITESTYPDIKLLLVGGEDAAHNTGLTHEQNKFYKNNKQITCIGFTADVDRYLAIADLFVFPSEKEGMPVSIMEALAMGVPVLTLNSRGCNDLIKNQDNGIVLQENASAQEIKKAILKLYHDRSLLKRLSVNALKSRDLLGRHLYVKEQINIYKSIVNRVK
ncbi:glycosyltransferase family 4 protein [Mucilaginibacter robiniae]|uniref:Glycosyltransferase family 4 protein n=1 Tax=Mucilaginibacter robiniae TaxID=2728022 RepID=A0A7L5E5F4_9SPHI|nr:glycosyltransferase [Mucilaginibacter robiniae]QJD97539.1 glycosyltransferase family 4 protein [Mucilaginibacter robiniae]